LSRPRILATTFPKSGTHLLVQMLRPLAEPSAKTAPRPDGTERLYINSHNNGGWGPDLRAADEINRALDLIRPGEYAVGHLSCWPTSIFERVVAWGDQSDRWAVIFLYRDLRDVAVSETYHIEHPDESIGRHPFKAEFNVLPDHQARIRAIITGHAGHPPLLDRFEEYLGWVLAPQVLPMRYEDLRTDPHAASLRILRYLRQFGPDEYDDDLADAMVASIYPEGSPTFRAGRVGDWIREFDAETTATARRWLSYLYDFFGTDERSGTNGPGDRSTIDGDLGRTAGDLGGGPADTRAQRSHPPIAAERD
jgi:hypothetical protein